MMKRRNNNIATLIYFILIEIMLKHNALAQNRLCTLNTIEPVPNICDHSNYLVYVSESESDCRPPGSKCWCILVDNRNLDYSGDMMIELVEFYNRKSLHSNEMQFEEFKSYHSFKIISGGNRFIINLNQGAISDIASVKIHNTEVCKLGDTVPVQQITNENTSSISNEDYSSRAYTDCIQRNTYTENSIKFCPTERPEFMIEQRITFNNQTYWCININNDNNLLTAANHLYIDYSNPHPQFVYSSSDENIDTGFNLGNRKTFIAISGQNNHLINFNSVTIDNKTICSYFDEPVPTTTPLTTTTTITTTEPITPRVSPRPNDNSNDFMPKCGIKSTHKNSLISFGSKTSPGDWPWHAAIFRLQLKTAIRIFKCGGTLINQKSVITAAHCVVEVDSVITSEHLAVDLGRHNLLHSSVATQEYPVYDVIPHEGYKSDTFENDIAILILANYVQITRYVNFICLPNSNEILQHQVGKAVGWGRDENNQIQPDLKVVTIPVVEHITCLESNRAFFGQYLTRTNFCAGFLNNTNLCTGDSGGGLVFRSQVHWFLGGITSLGVSAKLINRECDTSQYVIFTDVTKFIPWITSNS